MSAIEVSVIILTYRQEATIGRAIESVLAQQTGFDYEIILADDCSPDCTGAICREYARRYPGRIRLVDRPRNVGLVDSYFECVDLARGRYIADCAGDDFWLGEDSLQRRRDMLAADPALALVHADWVECDAGGRTVAEPCGTEPRYAPVTSGRGVLERLLAHDRPVAVHLSTALYRADLLRDALAADRSLIHNRAYGCEDLPVMAALLARGDAGYIHMPVLAYTVGGDTVSNPSDLRKAFAFYESTAVCTLDLAERYGVGRRIMRGFLRRRSGIMTAIAFALRDRRLMSRASEVSRRSGVRPSVKTLLRRLMAPLMCR